MERRNTPHLAGFVVGGNFSFLYKNDQTASSEVRGGWVVTMRGESVAHLLSEHVDTARLGDIVPTVQGAVESVAPKPRCAQQDGVSKLGGNDASTSSIVVLANEELSAGLEYYDNNQVDEKRFIAVRSFPDRTARVDAHVLTVELERNFESVGTELLFEQDAELASYDFKRLSVKI